mmetsp:Transcript_43135/g.119317  ORF Transcript_43135/g.119317 Transcript_43135/m.119317 type:complete len:82 (-) Transcript_43135:201-446(-)
MPRVPCAVPATFQLELAAAPPGWRKNCGRFCVDWELAKWRRARTRGAAIAAPTKRCQGHGKTNSSGAPKAIKVVEPSTNVN